MPGPAWCCVGLEHPLPRIGTQAGTLQGSETGNTVPCPGDPSVSRLLPQCCGREVLSRKVLVFFVSKKDRVCR